MSARATSWVVLGVLALTFGGCGKKADPLVPKKEFALAVRNLEANLSNGEVILTGHIPGAETKDKTKRVVGMLLYHTRYGTDSAPCEGCPIDFPGYREVKGEVVRGDTFFYTLGKSPTRGVHFFQVRLMAEDGGLGPPSNVTRITVGN